MITLIVIAVTTVASLAFIFARTIFGILVPIFVAVYRIVSKIIKAIYLIVSPFVYIFFDRILEEIVYSFLDLYDVIIKKRPIR